MTNENLVLRIAVRGRPSCRQEYQQSFHCRLTNEICSAIVIFIVMVMIIRMTGWRRWRGRGRWQSGFHFSVWSRGMWAMMHCGCRLGAQRNEWSCAQGTCRSLATNSSRCIRGGTRNGFKFIACSSSADMWWCEAVTFPWRITLNCFANARWLLSIADSRRWFQWASALRVVVDAIVSKGEWAHSDVEKKNYLDDCFSKIHGVRTWSCFNANRFRRRRKTESYGAGVIW